MNQGSELSQQDPEASRRQSTKACGAPHIPGTVPGMGARQPAGPAPALSELMVTRGPVRRQQCTPHRPSSAPWRNEMASDVSFKLAAGGYFKPS